MDDIKEKLSKLYEENYSLIVSSKSKALSKITDLARFLLPKSFFNKKIIEKLEFKKISKFAYSFRPHCQDGKVYEAETMINYLRSLFRQNDEHKDLDEVEADVHVQDSFTTSCL
jgi:hypothetical protein